MKSIIFNEIKKILECDFALENPKDKNLAHFATPLAFSLAKELKKSPMLIASDLASKFQNHDCFESVEAVNGYLNFRISKTFLNELANQALTNPNDFTKGEKKQDRLLTLGKESRRSLFYHYHYFIKSLRRSTKLLLRYFSRTILFSASSSGVPWNRIFPSNNR